MKGPAIAASLLAIVYASTALHGASQVQGQPTAAPAFEVASIKASNPDASNPLSAIPMILPNGGGRIIATNAPLKNLVLTAFELKDWELFGGPAWVTSRKWDIQAKAENPNATPKEMMAMLRTLLADRFHLKTHTETRDLPVGVLVVARSDGKLGPNLKPSTADCTNAREEQQRRAEAILKGGPGALANALPKPGEPMTCVMMPVGGAGGFGLRGRGQPIAMLVQLLTQATGRIVEDKTGLTGLYDFELRFDPEVLMRMASQIGVNLPPGVTLPPSDSPSLLTALNEQLGLKVESGKGPVEVLVIDSAEMPAAD